MIGHPLPRFEDLPLIQGKGCFVDDNQEQPTLLLEIFRSSSASTKLESFNLEVARAVKGVTKIFTPQEVEHLGKPAVNGLIPNMTLPPFSLLNTHFISVGVPIFAIVGENPYALKEALEKISLETSADTQQLPIIFDQLLHEGDVEEAFKKADIVVETQIQHAKLAPFALEPHSILAHFDGEELTVHLSTQTPHRARVDFASLLSLPIEKVRVIANNVGGGFGGKASITPEELLCVYAAFALQSRVKWIATRSEEFLYAPHGRGTKSKGRMALNKKGQILGLEGEFTSPIGAYLPFSVAAPARNLMRMFVSGYDVPAQKSRVYAKQQPLPPSGIYRGAGRPESILFVESLLDKAARALKLDPLELRKRNLTKILPKRLINGDMIDGGDFFGLLEKLEKASDYKNLRKTISKRQRQELVGLGVAFYVEPCGMGFESATITMNSKGEIVAASGTSAQGQGQETIFKQIIADILDFPIEKIILHQGDTKTSPKGVGAVGSRSTGIGGSALKLACEKFLTALKSHFNEEINLSILTPAQLNYATTLKIEEVFTAKEAWASGAVLCVIKIDAETYKPHIEKLIWVDDAGVLINPMTAKGQLIGGAAQGIGEALFEELRYDTSGQLLTGSLMDYAVMRAQDMPPLDIITQETPTNLNALGAKGVGEAGCIGVPAAIRSATLDALQKYNLQDIDFPITGNKIFNIIEHFQ